MKSIIKAALSIDELANNLQQIAQDDKKEVNDYTDSEIVHEAKYILSCFHEDGHLNNEDYIGENGEEFQKSACDQVCKLNTFIKKFG
jgi:predicted SAM-dependent methyltransferase